MTIPRRIIRRAVVESTMDEIDALAAAGEPEGVVVVADLQRAGRGRAGRAWDAPAGAAILCSILLRPELPPERILTLPLVVGVAVAETLEAVAPVRCRLKWPNDVWIDGQKVAGILVAARGGGASPHVTLGIGINVSTPAAALPPGATSLAEAAGHAVDREHVLASLLAHLDDAYAAFRAAGGRPDLDPWRARAALIGENVVVQNGAETIRGWARGISDQGHFLVEDAAGVTHRVVAGDLTRGPRASINPTS